MHPSSSRDWPGTSLSGRSRLHQVRQWCLQQVRRLLVQLARACWRHRRRLAPVYAGLGVWLLAAALYALPDGWRTALALAALTTVCGWWWWRRRGRRMPTTRRRYTLTVYTYTWVWVTAASVYGPWPPMLAAWLWPTVAACVWWWWHLRARPAPLPDARLSRWYATVASPQGRLPDTHLSAPQPVTYTPPAPRCERCGGHGHILHLTAQGDLHPDEQACPGCGGTGTVGQPPPPQQVGWSALGQLPSGRLETSDAVTATGKIASAFSVPVQSVMVDGPATGENDRFILRVYERNPLQDVHYWGGPQQLDTTTGLVTIGLHADMAPLQYRFWESGSGPWHTLISGTTGAGKSTVLNLLLAVERRWEIFTSVVIDPQGGASLPDWQGQVAHYARTPQEGVQVLLRVDAELTRRNQLLSSLQWVDHKGRPRTGLGHFDPYHPAIQALGLPMISVTIDEAPEVLAHPLALQAAERIAKLGRKCGIKLRLVTQVPLVEELGGSSVLKDMVASGNVLVFRTGTALSGQVAFSGLLPVDPHKLPRTWPDGSSTGGLVYAVGGEARTVPARINHPGDTYEWARLGVTTPLLLPELEPPPPPPPTAGAELDARGGTAKERVLTYLHDRSGETARTGVIADKLGLPLSTVSTALAGLQAEGAVVNQGHGKWKAVEGRRGNGG